MISQVEITDDMVRRALLRVPKPVTIRELADLLVPQGTAITTEIRTNIGFQLRFLRRGGLAIRTNPGERPALYWADI